MLPILFRGHDEPGFFAHALGMSAAGSPLAPIPGNQPVDGDRYACLIVVRDYHRMRKTNSSDDAWHYSALEPNIIADVREGRAVLIFDLSNEGPAYAADIFTELYVWIEYHRLPPGRCIWLAQNRLMARSAAAHAGVRGELIRFAHYDYFVKLMAWNFSRLLPQEPEVSGTSVTVGRLFDITAKDKLLLCLNATPRLGRVITVAALHQHQLMGRSLVSFPGMRYVKAGVAVADVLRYVEASPTLEPLRPWVHVVARSTGYTVDQFREQGNALVEKIDPHVYERTFFSLVTESDFPEEHIQRVTEKTVKAFCMGHPPLIVGNANSIAIMSEYGFQDWSSVFDRSIEQIMDPIERFDRTIAETLRQVKLIKENPAAWLAASQEVGVYNFRYAVTGQFLNHYIETVDHRLVEDVKALIAA